MKGHMVDCHLWRDFVIRIFGGVIGGQHVFFHWHPGAGGLRHFWRNSKCVSILQNL